MINESESVQSRKPGRPKVESVPTDAVRQELGWSQEKLARELNCTLSAVRRMEAEARLPGAPALRDAFAILAKDAGVELD